ncbi:PhlD [Streptomyces sp. H51]|uniref:PhlD n=1 Tax=Streptomyces sp. H51 TaxID=3111770 RepID=UPI002D778935|nr:PhlD [Streptomyces sp. H51]
MRVVSAPVVVLPRHQVTTEEVLERITELYADHPRCAHIRRTIAATTVRTRWYTRPLAEQMRGDWSLAVRTREHLADSLELAEKAARTTLREAGLEPSDVDALVVVSATGHTTPGLDVLLMARLGLPPSVRRIPVTQLGCTGGVFGISMAAELVAARPDATVLVVCADVFSHYLHRADTGMDGMIFKGILGDGAGACVVRSRANGPHMELTHSWECVQPLSHDIVGSHLDGDGFHAHNSPDLVRAIRGVMPRLNEWLARTAPAGSDGTPEFVVSHTGSPKVLDALVEGIGCPPALFGLARDSLREVGNLGSASVLEVLERAFAKPPADGAHGLALGVGPGVSVMAVRTVWRDGV